MSKSRFLKISGNAEHPIDNALLQNAFDVFCTVTGLSKNTEASLVFCNSDEMRKINRRFRGTDKTTDVLSFPAEQTALVNLFEDNELRFIGEILIDTNYVMQHKEHTDFRVEMIYIFVHGLLHLIGYDHQKTLQSIDMKMMESEIIKKITQDGTSD